MSKTGFYVTTPIYYVNGAPHIGHAYTTILADVLARYHRLLGEPTFFLTGTDEHGQKVQRAAEKAGVSPLAHADATAPRFQALWEKLGITNDDFIRTTEERHVRVVQAILSDLYERGEIYKADYDGWYCVPCERFFTERDTEDLKCPDCARPLEKVKESNYFFRMGKRQEWLIEHIKTHPKFIQPDFRANETLGFLRKKLNDLCISRAKSRLSWGIELPFDKDFVTYVWFDALVNYISAAGYRGDDEKFARWWPASCHLIGKDILTTHTVYWPTMLHAMGLPMPETIFAHGWWLTGESKMSKSSGNTANPMEMADKYGVDAFRYFLLAEMTMGQDASFSEEAFVRRYNSDLANDLGNLASRVLKLTSSHTAGRVPQPGAGAGEPETALRSAVETASRDMEASILNLRLDAGLGSVMAAVREANRYMEKKQPWTLAKQGKQDELDATLYAAVEALRVVSGLLYPVMPSKMAEVRACLGLGADAPEIETLRQWGLSKPGVELGKSLCLFPRVKPVDTEPAAAAPAAQAGAGAEKETAGKIEYADFARVELRTARILSAEIVPGANKLLKLQIKIGEEQRQLVAGIALHYKPEELIGKTIVVVANLKPARIRGVESDGMLLAASSGETLRLLTVDGEIPDGAQVK